MELLNATWTPRYKPVREREENVAVGSGGLGGCMKKNKNIRDEEGRRNFPAFCFLSFKQQKAKKHLL